MEYKVDNLKKIYFIDESNIEHLFVPITNNNKKDDNLLLLEKNISLDLDTLPDMIYGKILINCEGYNPNGWWKYIEVKKNKLIYK